MIDPPKHTKDHLEVSRLASITEFRRERMEEPLEDYLQAFDEYLSKTEELLETTVDLAELDTHALTVFTDASLLEVVRYAAGPPISHDDLKTLTAARSLVASTLRKEPKLVRTLTETILIGLDARRFPWLKEGRDATDAERSAAALATAALLATRRVGTKRRSAGKAQQELRVEAAFLEAGLTKVATRPVQTLSLAPNPGEFCRESMLGSRKADFILRLWDHRIMAIECKVSNSSTNSVKRLNNDAAAKATAWISDFGTLNVIPAAVLSGVYKIHNLLDAQDRGLSLFWAHDLQGLLDWIDATR